MERDICWIGDSPIIKPLELEVELSFQRGVDRFSDANSGLGAVLQKQYPLILVDNVVPAGDLVLPEQIPPDDCVGIGCYIIKRIREGGINKSTPVLVTHTGDFLGYNRRQAFKKYVKAGASHFVDLTHLSSPLEFAKILRLYLQ